jgi:hypothetical protein
MKKMSEAKKLKPGPKRKLSDSARKRNKKAANEYDSWMEIKTAFCLETNSEVANIIFVSIYIPLFSLSETLNKDLFTWKINIYHHL